MGSCCGKPSETSSTGRGWRGATASGHTSGSSGSSGSVLAFVGLSGAGKSALLHTLVEHDRREESNVTGGGRTSSADGSAAMGTTAGAGRQRLSAPAQGGNAIGDGECDDDDGGGGGNREGESRYVERGSAGFTLEVREGVLCAPPPTTRVTVTRIRAAGVVFTTVDIPGDRAERGRWGAAVEGSHGGGAATAVVFVVDAADELRMPVVRGFPALPRNDAPMYDGLGGLFTARDASAARYQQFRAPSSGVNALLSLKEFARQLVCCASSPLPSRVAACRGQATTPRRARRSGHSTALIEYMAM